MTTVTLSAGATTRDRIDQLGLWSVIGLVAAAQLSIAASQILLTLSGLCWLASHLLRRERLEAPAFFWPLVGYAALTLLAAGFSRDPVTSVTDCKQLALFLLIPVVFDFARGARARTILTVIITVGAISALVGLVQYAILNYDDLGRRPQGTLSHWMTYSGTLMLVICAAVARLLFGSRDRAWAAVVMPALVVILLLTFTRSAMVGVTAGVGVLLLLRNFRLVALLPIIAAAVIAVAPADVTARIYSMIDLNDPTIRDRMAMLQAGTAIVKDYPLTGVGPDMVGQVYPDYRVANAVQEHNMHLHNVPMQIAAERGLPALLMWLWFIGSALVGLKPLLLRTRHRALAAAAMGAIAAMLTAGFFEYNFGDSEFLMLFLTLITLPFAAERDGGLP
ncbi:MAG TPA: O-antigen ligase family protein [Vicinamibacterales bacterium]|nr:O-antigen ligase family protein [Vicinamibacterales bacterium]